MSFASQPLTNSGYLLQHVAGVLQRQTDQVLQEQLGIGMSQYRILMLLQERAMEQRKIADYLGQTEASISRQVKLLLERGMVTSRVDPQERRRHFAMATPKGIKVTQAAQELLDQYHEPLLEHLSRKQQDQLREILTNLHEHTCIPGKPMACDRVGAIETIYDNQKAAA